MLEKELSFADLSISLSELYEAMGYADAVPDEAVEKEVRGVLGRVEAVTSPRFCFFISGGELDESKDSLSVGDTCFSIGKIITRQLRGSESFAFFAATAGTGFERFQHTLLQEGDMVKVYIADAIGSVIAEKTADCIEIALDEYIRDRGWRHTTVSYTHLKLFTVEEWQAIQNGEWTDWIDEVLHTGLVQSHQVTASGGTEKTTAMSVSYTHLL